MKNGAFSGIVASPVFKATIICILISSLVLAWPAARNLEYEYALAVSWLILLVGLGFGFFLPVADCRRWRILSPADFFSMLIIPVSTLIPGAVIFGAKQCACSGMGFLFWMFLLALPACWIGLGLMLSGLRLRENRSSNRWILPAVILILVAVAMSMMWFFPQKRLTSITLGILHGPIYDRWIPVDYGMVWARGIHAVIGITLMVWGGRVIHVGRGIGYAVGTSLVVLLILASNQPSQRHGFGALDEALPEVIRDNNIEIHYFRGSSKDEETARALAKEGDFHVMEIKAALGVTLPAPIKVYAYTDSDQKKILFGGGQTDITDVWTPSVHIELEPSPHSTLRHELVHAVASYVSWLGVGFHPNMVITEGLAMALAPTNQTLSFDRMAASLIKSGRLSSPEELFRPLGFWSEAGSRSYLMAGSLIRWISAKFGSSALKAIYSGTSLNVATGSSEASIISMWKQDVLSVHRASDDMVVESLTREPSVLEDICPHSIEDLSRAPSTSLLVRLRQPHGWNVDKFKSWRAGLDPRDRAARLDFVRDQINTLMKSSNPGSHEIQNWMHEIKNSINWPPRVLEDIEFSLLLSDLERVGGMTAEAQERLSSIVESFATKDPGSSIRRQVEARVAVERLSSLERIIEWRRYLAGWGTIPGVLPGASWIEHYLFSKRVTEPTLAQLQAWEGDITKATGSPAIYREWLRMVAAANERLRNYTAAARLYMQLEDVSRGESKALTAEHIRRMRFFETDRLAP